MKLWEFRGTFHKKIYNPSLKESHSKLKPIEPYNSQKKNLECKNLLKLKIRTFVKFLELLEEIFL